MKTTFLDLGRQPIANGFLTAEEFKNEYFFDLRVTFDEETYLVSLEEFVPPEKMFNENYVYYSSMSRTMRDHFKDAATTLKNNFGAEFNLRIPRVLEIGSNDGVFVQHFVKETTTAVEPCKNFADITNAKGYHTYSEFWTPELAYEIVRNRGGQDLIFSANCICHIGNLDKTFKAVDIALSSGGIFVFEDPSLLKMVERGSYDQIYDEHAHVFSVLALDRMLSRWSLEIFKVENLAVHGGSNRIYVKKRANKNISIDKSVQQNMARELEAGLNKLDTFEEFAKRVKQSKIDLVEILERHKANGKKVVSYGATSKSTTVFNYCGIGADLIEYVVDTTPDKQNKFAPGSHIPVVPPDRFDKSVDVAYLGAWNYEKEILHKEEEFVKRGGTFISHVPHVRTL